MLLRALLALFLPLAAAAQAAPAPPALPFTYEVVSVHDAKPDAGPYRMGGSGSGISATNVTLRALMGEAFGYTLGDVTEGQIVGLPTWGSTRRFDIQARVDPANVAQLNAARRAATMAVWVKAVAERKPTVEIALLQQMVTDLFHLKLHFEQRPMPVYELRVARGGAKMPTARPTNPEDSDLTAEKGKITGKNIPAELLPSMLAQEVDRPILDRTGLTGHYDVTLNFTPDTNAANAPGNTDAPLIFQAIESQLGLKLVPAKEPAWVIVIDHAELPVDLEP